MAMRASTERSSGPPTPTISQSSATTSELVGPENTEGAEETEGFAMGITLRLEIMGAPVARAFFKLCQLELTSAFLPGSSFTLIFFEGVSDNGTEELDAKRG